MTMANMIFSEKIKFLIKRSGKTMTQVADDMGFPPTTVNNWTKGTAYPRNDRLQAIAKYFNVDVTYLVDDSAPVNPNGLHARIYDQRDNPNLGITESSVGWETIADLDAENLIPISSRPSTYNIPILGKIWAGTPDGVEQDHDGEIEILESVAKKYKRDELMALRVDGESMNKVAPNGSIAIIHKTSEFSNGDIVAVIINGYAGTLKHVYRYPDRIIFEPDSWDSSITPFEYTNDQIQNDDPTVVFVGKYLYSINGV